VEPTGPRPVGGRTAPTGPRNRIPTAAGRSRGRSADQLPILPRNRTAYLAVLDQTGRAFLAEDSAKDSAGLALPSRDVPAGHGYAQTARQLALDVRLSIGSVVRWTRVAGSIGTSDATVGTQPPGEARVYVCRAERTCDPLRTGPGRLRWVDCTHLVGVSGVPDLDLLVKGYLEGWIPDGLIGLE
jgi:hypothetical protein